jgi:uncharacterized surface protein with fasciclin (FAS1) repeats
MDDGLVTKLLVPDWKPQLVDLLEYHVVLGKKLAGGLKASSLKNLNGEGLAVTLDPVVLNNGNGTVTQADIAASNGVIHTVEAVLLPTSVTSNVVEVAQATEGFSTLVAAVIAADLAEVLSGDGPFTVFAPTNAAFDALPEGTLDDLLKPENKDTLASILTYHVVSGNIPASAVTTSDVPTFQGEDLSIQVSDAGVVRINDAATVVQTDVLANNGIIHVIDAILEIPSVSSLPAASSADTPAAPSADTPAAPSADTPAAPSTDDEDDEADGAVAYGTIVAALAVAVGMLALA